ncbi:hypothetical protein [Corynebacterium tapiri]|uniref:Uncharacterized protein n=1 Tax=Corynebacterium tapiri TaxID=1448266 RepID=A0A5C4U4V8_9CORY|nr:hypothetical protein [Corynebacterium tapiri]TNL97592.1 hypothetical protein FHE74_05740 [Corynebacterium tapiri]
MDMRAEVYSPLQNASVWLAAWVHGMEPADEMIEAWASLGYSASIDLLGEIRQRIDLQDIPSVRLVLSGAGDAMGLPGDHRESIALAGCGLLLPTWENEDEILTLGPSPALAPPMWLSPGEADSMLSAAVDQAANLVEASGYRTDSLRAPRLTVGTLADFYDTPGLPPSIPPRAAKLFARTDQVAAIIETVKNRVGEHSLDAHLLPLLRVVRTGRMVGVTYAAAEYAKLSRRPGR